MKIILLMGFTASGKTTLGNLLASYLKCPFIDMDNEITKKVTMSVRAFYKKHGKKVFQDVEFSVLKEICNLKNIDMMIVSAGGGLIENNLARNLIKTLLSNTEILKVFFLHVSKKILFKRLSSKSKKEHSFPAFLQEAYNNQMNLKTQLKYAKHQFYKIYKKRMKLQREINAIKIRVRKLKPKKIVKIMASMS